MLKKDKIKVIDETLDDDKVRRFMLLEPRDGEEKNFHILLMAYRGLNEVDFERFITFFREDNLNINSTNREGKTILQVIKNHVRSQSYINSLKSGGCEF